MPESFKVLVKELEGLGLTVSIDYSDGTSGPLPIDDDDDGPRRPSDIDNITASDMMFAAAADLPAQPAERNAAGSGGEEESEALPDADEANAGGEETADPEAREMPNLNE